MVQLYTVEKSILVVFIFLSIPGYPQETAGLPNKRELSPIIENNFDNGYSKWPLVRYGASLHTRIRNKLSDRGFYYLITNNYYSGTEREVYLDHARDFSITIRYAQLLGKNKRARFILSWGGGWKSSHHSITVESDNGGRVLIYSPTPASGQNSWLPATVNSNNRYTESIDFETQDLELISILDNMEVSGIAINEIKIEQYNQKMVFNINSNKVYECDAMPWFENIVGFGGSGPSVLLIDDIQIKGYFSSDYDSIEAYLPQNLGPTVNTKADVLRPQVSLDGKTIYFNNYQFQMPNERVDISEFAVATTKRGDDWIVENVSQSVNAPRSNGFISMSSDRNMLLFYGFDSSDFKITNRIKSEHNKEGWSELKRFGPEFKNEDVTLSGSLAPTGRALIFDAKLKQNLFYNPDPSRFEHDVYISLMNEHGSWSAPINLGPVINTAAMEINPVLASDGRTLYFSRATTPPGYGWVTFKLFMARRLSDSWTDWTVPIQFGQHIGYVAYTEGKYYCAPVHYTIPACGDLAYFSSAQEGYGGADIFKIKIPDHLRPDPVVLLKGKVLNAASGTPMETDIIIRDLNKGVEVSRGRSDPLTGEYVTALPYGANYGIYAASSDFIPVRENLDLSHKGGCTELTMELVLVPIQDGASVQLKNVFFFRSLPRLRPESFDELNAMVLFLKSNPAIAIELQGHTDNVGDYKLLMKLSRDRVETVKNFLTSQGIDPKRIRGKGYGPNKPIAPNDTEDNKSRNRRVEAVIRKKS